MLIKSRKMKDSVARNIIGGLACQLASHYRCIQITISFLNKNRTRKYQKCQNNNQRYNKY